MCEDKLKINPPIFLIGKKIACWCCYSKMSAVIQKMLAGAGHIRIQLV